MDAATVDELLALDAAIKSRVDGDDVALEEVNYRLHQTIYAVAESPRLVWFINASGALCPRRFWGTIPGWFEHNRDGHEAVIRAVADSRRRDCEW